MENGKLPAFGGKKLVKSSHPMLDDVLVDVNGLTKREYFAGLALQGLLCSPLLDKRSRPFEIAVTALAMADALLAELEKTKPE